MTAPNMAAITASLERSLQNCSLNQESTTSGAGEFGFGRSSTSSDSHRSTNHRHNVNPTDATLELNSNISLPYHWEQCLDLKTGEVYYINWRTGMKAKEDPRKASYGGLSGYFYSDDDDDEDEEEGNSYDSEGSSTESSPAVSSSRQEHKGHDHQNEEQEITVIGGGGPVLVVAGCKCCLMYFMVPKHVKDCPKCCGQLLHFDRSDDNASP